MAQQTVLLWASGNQKGFAAKRENFLIFIFLKSLTLCVDLVFVHPCQAGFVCGGRGVLIRGLLFCVISLDMRFPASGCDTTQSVSAYQIDPPPHFSGSSPKVSFVRDEPMAAVCVWTLADKGNISNKWTKYLRFARFEVFKHVCEDYRAICGVKAGYHVGNSYS